MNLSTYANVVGTVLRSTAASNVLIIFHGGEPSVLDVDWFTSAVNIGRSEANLFGKKVRFGMQSNLLSISNEKFALFKSLDISISASVDGPSDIAAAERPLASKVQSNFQRALQNGITPSV